MLSHIGVPDVLALSRLGRAQADAKRNLEQAQTEMTTGEAQDRHRATGGDLTRVMALERSVSTLDSRTPLLAMARSRAEGTQTALETIQKGTEGMGLEMLRNITTGDLSSAKITARDSRAALGQVLGALNTQLSGRHLFAGAGTGAPMPDPAALLADIEAVFTLSETEQLTATDGLSLDARIEANLDLYFTKGSVIDVDPDPIAVDERSFDALFAGGDDPMAAPPVELADGEHLSYAIRGDAAQLRAMIRGLATAATTVEHFAGTDETTLSAMLDRSGTRMMAAYDDITKLRATLGLAESRIEEAQTKTTAERTALVRARADLIGVDEYAAATRVVELETQLQAIYAMTARSTQLSLLNFLR